MRTSKLRSQLLSFASLSAIAFAATPALAQQEAEQDAEVAELEEITVTGLRASIMSSVARKRESSSIVEAISAEDLGKLPDQSIAESIARLPGLAAQRLDGRANVISIRGLAPDFTTTTLNGREQVSASNGRAVEYDQYPSELINGVVIYKTPDASLTSQAVGGTVDLQTIRPLQYGQRALVFNVRGEYNDLGALNSGTSATGYRASFSYVDQFADDTIGVAIGYARMLSPTQEERWQAWGFDSISSGGSSITDDEGNLLHGLDSNDVILGGAKPYVKSNELTRDGLLGVLEFAPHDSAFRTTIDAYYSSFDDEQTLRGIEIPMRWSQNSLQKIGPNWTSTDGVITNATFTDTEVVVRNDFVDRKADTVALGWNTEYDVNESLRLELDASYSKVERTERNTEVYLGTGRGAGNGALDTIGYSLEGEQGAVFSHNLDYSDPSLIMLGGPLNWGGGLAASTDYGPDGQDGFVNAPETDDELMAVRLSAEQMLDNGFLSSIEYGARYAKREKSLLDQGYFLTLKDYPADVPVPSDLLLDPTSLDFIGMGDVIAIDARALVESGAYVVTDEALSTVSRTTNSWTVTEKVFNAYIQGNIDAMLGDMNVTGNVGVQAVHTNQYSDGFGAAVDNGSVVVSPVRDGAKYWDFLPSLNLSFNLNDDNKIRVGIAQVLARGKMSDMNAGFSFGYDNTQNRFTATGGNPQLRPFKTWQFDLSYETYFGEGGYASIAGFYKQIGSYPFKTTTTYDFSGVLGDLAGTITLPDGTSVPDVGVREQIDNIDGGKIYGLELSASIPFSMMSDALEGFGFLGSASFTKSSIEDPSTGEDITLLGLSETVLNGTIYYEKNGFQARTSVRHRSKFLGEVSALSLTRALVTVDPETIVDAQVSYDLSEVGIDGLTVLFQVNNLTNQEFITRFDNGYVRDYQNYGRTYLFGLNYKM